VTAPLWDLPAAEPGALRGILTRQIEAATAAGADLPEDLALIALSLADRIDQANVRGERRGFVLLTSEYRQARGDLFAGVAAASDADTFDAALAEFVEKTAL
jgi:phosphate uptake regulator